MTIVFDSEGELGAIKVTCLGEIRRARARCFYYLAVFSVVQTMRKENQSLEGLETIACSVVI